MKKDKAHFKSELLKLTDDEIVKQISRKCVRFIWWNFASNQKWLLPLSYSIQTKVYLHICHIWIWQFFFPVRLCLLIHRNIKRITWTENKAVFLSNCLNVFHDILLSCGLDCCGVWSKKGQWRKSAILYPGKYHRLSICILYLSSIWY